MTDISAGHADPARPSCPHPDAEAGAIAAPIAYPVLEALLLLAGFSLLTAIFFWPLLPHVSTALLGPPEDNYQDFWNSWYASHPHGGFFFTRLIRFPEGVSLIYHSFAYPQVFAVWVLSRLFGTSLPALLALQNLTLLASFPLSAMGGFYLCRHLARSQVAALAGGFVFAFSPWHVAQAMHHAHIASIEFVPFFVLCYLLASERRSLAWLSGAIVFFVLCALSSWYYLFYGCYFLGFHLLYLRLREGRWPRGWALGAPFLCIIGALVLLSPLILPMAAHGLEASAYQAGGNLFVADLLGYVSFPPSHALAGWSAGLFDTFAGNPWEASVYLGLVNLALLGWGLWRAKGERTLSFALGGMVFFAVLASGEALHVAGHALHLPLPDVVLDRLPFFANVRTPARALLFVTLFLGIGVASTAGGILKRGGTKSRLVLAVALTLALADFYPAHLEITPFACAPELDAIAKAQGNLGVLDLPFGYREADFYMAQQVCHGHPIAQGVVARQLAPTLADHLEVKDLARQRRALRSAGIGYILLHRPKDGLFLWNRERDGELASYRRFYSVLNEGPDITVLAVH